MTVHTAKGTTLLTGGTGFVGSAVARKLLARGHKVRVLTRPQSDLTNLQGLDVEVVHGDLSSQAGLPESVFESVGGLFHVAADYRLWVPNPEAMMEANVAGTERLMRQAQAAGVGRIVYCSSVAALATAHDGVPAKESDPISEDKVVGAYKKSKYRAERAVLRMAREEGLPAVVVNPSTPIGPRDIKPTPTGKMIWDCMRGRMPAYVDTGLNVVHVDDVAEGHLLAFEKGRVGENYILGGQNIWLRDLFAMIASMVGRPAPKVRLPRWALYPLALGCEGAAHAFGIQPMVTREMLAMSRKLMFFTSRKAYDELGYRPRTAQAAVAAAVQAFAAQGGMALPSSGAKPTGAGRQAD
ncbi:NAD-dependent epimerase/dehydratase family protein [Formicincola oecophyllae]|uniref:NAD-dependent epimerase/dehydratase family protein n=1 Tax=Formicincola oecophyllae TaxID=2558361 RepID=A0A4Y6U9S2_9PROT|nr:hopanoid-associated sugar epimerase [Formicincola oecophyllae]QDH13954.1 NAD-dependent epimerase/dehydratase family protein [Formicincola oecophyllae]